MHILRTSWSFWNLSYIFLVHFLLYINPEMLKCWYFYFLVNGHFVNYWNFVWSVLNHQRNRRSRQFSVEIYSIHHNLRFDNNKLMEDNETSSYTWSIFTVFENFLAEFPLTKLANPLNKYDLESVLNYYSNFTITHYFLLE